MAILNNIKLILDIFLGFAVVFSLLFKFLDRFFDYKISEWETKTAKKNRCFSSKGKQR